MKQKLLSLLVLLTMCVGGWATPITGLSDIDYTKVYTIKASENSRGALVYSAANPDKLCGSARVEAGALNNTDPNFLFAFIKDGDNTFLYSIGGAKYAYYADPNAGLQEEKPATGISLLASTGGAKANYPTVINFLDGNHQINMSKDQHQGALTNWNNTADGGNMLAIEAVDGCTFDAETMTFTDNRITLTYIYKHDGQEIGREQVVGRIGSPYPACTYSKFGTTYTAPTGTVANDDPVEIELSVSLPFAAFDSFNNITTWYALEGHSNQHYYMYYEEDAIKFVQNDYQLTDAYAWGFIGDPFNGFKIVNKAAGATMMLSDDNPCTMSETENVVTLCPSRISVEGGFCMKTTGQYYNYQNGAIARWNDNDQGSTFQVHEIDLSVDAEFKTKKAAALAIINNVPVLFGNAETAGTPANTAKAAIEAIQYDATSAESVAEAVAKVQPILSTMYASVQDKKVVFFNDNRSNKYMVVVDAVQLAGADAADGRSEFSVTGNADGQFTIKNTATGRYIANTPGRSSRVQLATEAGKFTIKSFGTSDKFAFISVTPADAQHNSLHLNSGFNVVAWEADNNGNASVWVVQESSLTAEQLADGVTAVKTQAYATIGSVEGLEIGTGLNQYTATAEAQAALEAKQSTDMSKSFEEILAMKNVIANGLDINKPADGSFIRIRSVKNGMGYVNAETSSAHSGCLAVGEEGNSSIYCYTDGKLVAYTNGMKLVKNSDGSGFLALGEAGAEGANIAFAGATRQNGAYTVTFDGRYLYAGDDATNVDAGSSEGNNGYDFWLEQVTELPVTLTTVGEHSYATFYAPVGITDLDGVQAFVVNVEGDRAKMTSVTEIPAETPVVLYAADGKTEATLTVGDVTEQNNANMLAGTVATMAAEDAAEDGVLTLQNNNESGIGFYAYTGTNLKGFRAYIPAEQAAGVKGLALDFDMETIVRGIEEAQQQKAEMFDLSGRRIQKAQKGIYIVNGKKVIK